MKDYQLIHYLQMRDIKPFHNEVYDAQESFSENESLLNVRMNNFNSV